mmetsp:Transcript_1433/g.1966  ORF Transcript_1433/g.1966 Transcript_1433/m.1966 type:complete len:294 (-) Transcript_1433:3993-4874(-)
MIPVFFGVGVCCFCIYFCIRCFSKDGKRKRILVTGAGRGIGRATAIYLQEQGDQVIACDIEWKGNEIEGVECIAFDVSEPEEVRAAAKDLERILGNERLDAIVNLAGIIRGGPLVEINPKDVIGVLGVNVVGTFNVNRYFFELLDQTHARIINVGSEISYAGMSSAFTAPYAMSKFAIEAYSTALGQELGNVKVIVLNPGAMKTDMLDVSYLERFRSSERFGHKISTVISTAKSYMSRNGVSPTTCAKAVHNCLHQTYPPRRVLVNVSWEMMLSSLVPQAVLDFCIAQLFSYS